MHPLPAETSFLCPTIYVLYYLMRHIRRQRGPMIKTNKTIPFVALTLLISYLLTIRAFADEGISSTDLFVGGVGGYAVYRIPALTVSASGTILAFTEARKNGPADQGDIDLVLRRSRDNGATWSDQRVVYDDGTHTIGNPSPVVDRDTKTILLLFNRDNVSVLLTRSDDDGLTWSPPADITDAVKQPSWKWVAMGPGHAIQLRSGRLLVPCDHSESDGMYSHVIFSDDHGRSWKLGGSLPRNTDEASAVELADGAVMINMRNNNYRFMRAVSVSADAGLTWSKIRFDRGLVEPVCEGSILRYSLAPAHGKNRLLFSNPASRSRDKMTVKLSYDEGATWPVARLVNPGPSGYSDLAVLPDMSVGLVYENGGTDYYEKITFARMSLSWLTNGKDSL